VLYEVFNMQRQFQEYDVPDTTEVNAGDIRTAPNGSKWIIESCVHHGKQYRLRVIPDTPANRKHIAKQEQSL
jgi:hypothetical protein